VYRVLGGIEMTEQKSNLIRLTGLWKSETKAGEAMLSGSFGPSSKLIVLPNSRKQKESDPDYIAFMAPHEKKDKQVRKPVGAL
jgi:hypothetical protein